MGRRLEIPPHGTTMIIPHHPQSYSQIYLSKLNEFMISESNLIL